MRHGKSTRCPPTKQKSLALRGFSFCHRLESDQRHMDFQSIALPTELQRRKYQQYILSAGLCQGTGRIFFGERKINAVVLAAARVERTPAMRARACAHIVADGERPPAHAAQHRLLAELACFPADDGVALALVMALIARIPLPAALEPYRHDVNRRMVMHAPRLSVHGPAQNDGCIGHG